MDYRAEDFNTLMIWPLLRIRELGVMMQVSDQNKRSFAKSGIELVSLSYCALRNILRRSGQHLWI